MLHLCIINYSVLYFKQIFTRLLQICEQYLSYSFIWFLNCLKRQYTVTFKSIDILRKWLYPNIIVTPFYFILLHWFIYLNSVIWKILNKLHKLNKLLFMKQ